MRVLVLGGAGLISTAITRQLLDRGDEVRTFTRGRTPHGFGDRVRTAHGDRGDPAALARAVRSDTFDAVVDVVCFEPDDVAPLVAVMRGRVPRLVWCSTVDVHTKGGALHPATRPPTSRTRGRSGCARRCSRTPPPAGRSSYPVMVARLRARKPIIVHGDGTVLWATCHREDVATAFVGALGDPGWPCGGSSRSLGGGPLPGRRRRVGPCTRRDDRTASGPRPPASRRRP